MVQAFDQSLSMKFNKSDHLVFKNKMDETYMRHDDEWPKILRKFGEIENEKRTRDEAL